MNAILDELEAVSGDSGAELELASTRAEAAQAWERFLRERGRGETPPPASVRWRDEEGL